MTRPGLGAVPSEKRRPKDSLNPSTQVAWYEGDKEYTKFSHYFSEALSQTPPVELGSIDEFINERLEMAQARGGTSRWSRWIRGSASPLSGEDGTDQVNFEMYGLHAFTQTFWHNIEAKLVDDLCRVNNTLLLYCDKELFLTILIFTLF